MISVDFEVFSEFNLSNGVYGYVADPSTELICCMFIADNGWELLWYPGQEFPQELRSYVENGGALSAYNAQFERLVWNNVGVQKHGWPPTTIQQWTCSAAQASCMATPRRLDHVAQFLGLDQTKDEKGKRVMMKLAKPNKKGERYIPRPGDLQDVYDYCRQDVVTERAVSAALRPMQDVERAVWELDQVINDRGVYVDRELAEAVLDVWETYSQALNEQCKQLTAWQESPNGVSATQVSKLLEWVNAWEQGRFARSSLTKDVVDELLSYENLPPLLRRVLEIRRQVGSSAVKKFHKFVSCPNSDSRLRGTIFYHGASTGRFAGRLIQPQNLARGVLKIDEIPIAMQLVKARDLAGMEAQWPGQVAQVLGSLSRPTIQAAPGHKLVVSDSSQIEARTVCWLAGQQDMLDIFADSKRDPYIEMAATIYGKSPANITDDERFLGKQTVLGCGYQMGSVRFQGHCKMLGVDVPSTLADHAVKAYRARNKNVVNFWYSLDRAAVKAVQTRKPQTVGRVSFWMSSDEWLHLRLPSGRDISYYHPKVVNGKFDNPQVQFRGVDSQTGRACHENMYGGKWAENATQAVARDIVVSGMFNAEHNHYPVVFTVHDEVVTEVPEHFGSHQHLSHLMCQLPAWADGLPVAAEGFESKFYRK